jgi:hypothetical protein
MGENMEAIIPASPQERAATASGSSPAADLPGDLAPLI